MAVPATDTDAVVEVLGLKDPTPGNWSSGLQAADAYPSDYVFVTPPVDGWVLAVGVGLPDPSDPGLLPGWRALMQLFRLSRPE